MKRVTLFLCVLTVCACGSQAVPTDPLSSDGVSTGSGPKLRFNADASAAEMVYDDGALVPPWYDASWTADVPDSATVLRNGKHTLFATFRAWAALCFDDDLGVAAGAYDTLSFDVYGGANTSPDLAVALYLNEQAWGPSVSIAPYCEGGSIPTNAWTHCAVPLSALGGATKTINEIAFEESAGKNLSAMAFSTIQLVGGGASDGGGALGEDAGYADASGIADTGVADATTVADARSFTDASSVTDATSITDATSVADAGRVTDAGSVADAGRVADAGSHPDGGGVALLPSMPHLTGRATYTSEGTASLLSDGAYRAPNAWTFTPAHCAAASPCWGAVNVGAGPSTLVVDWSYEDGEGDFDTTAWGGQTLTAYSWLVSANSTNGQDGTWSAALDPSGNPVTVAGNTLIHRSHRIQFAGFSWVKLAITSATANEVDEIDIWDATTTAADSFLFHGDSITHRCANLRGTDPSYGEQPSFQADMRAAHPGHYPLQVGAGIVGQGAADAAREAPAYLTQFPFVAHWFLTAGTNDLCGGASTFAAHAQAWINEVEAAGAEPILVHPIWANDVADYCPSNGPALNAAVDALVASNSLRPAVPLYEATVGHSNYFDSGDVHPNAAGCAVWNQTFASYAARFY